MPEHSARSRLVRAAGWMRRAACRAIDPEVFFPEAGHSTARARSICRSCTVQSECLVAAIRQNERHGVWGGLDGRERRQIQEA